MMQTTSETINIFSLHGDVLAHKINQNIHKQIKRKSAKSSLIQLVSVIGCYFVKVYVLCWKEMESNSIVNEPINIKLDETSSLVSRFKKFAKNN